MKKYLIVLTALCLMLLAVGCGEKSAAQPSTETTAATEAVTTATEETTPEQTVPEETEEEYELMSSYHQYYDIEFQDGTVTRSNRYADPAIEQTGTYRREKNLIYCDFDGYEVVYRLIGETLVNLTEDTCQISELEACENRLMYLDLKDIDFSSMENGGYIFIDGGKEYLYLDGTAYMNFCLGYDLKQDLVSVKSETRFWPESLSEHGTWSDNWLEACTSRYVSYDAFRSMYGDTISNFEMMAAYLQANKDTNPNCMSAYYQVQDRGCLMKYTHNQLMECIGALYYTIGEPEQAKAAFAGMLDPEAWLQNKYRREVTVNEFNQIIREPDDTEDRYVVEDNGLVVQNNDRGKITHYRYDDQGRLILKWYMVDSDPYATKYAYNDDGTVTVYGYMEDRYGNPLSDESTYALLESENRLGDKVAEHERVVELPEWLSEIDAW